MQLVYYIAIAVPNSLILGWSICFILRKCCCYKRKVENIGDVDFSLLNERMKK